MTAGISTIRDKTNGRRGCYHQTRANGLLRAKEYGRQMVLRQAEERNS